MQSKSNAKPAAKNDSGSNSDSDFKDSYKPMKNEEIIYVSLPDAYKTSHCFTLRNYSVCKKNLHCPFAHGIKELRDKDMPF